MGYRHYEVGKQFWCLQNFQTSAYFRLLQKTRFTSGSDAGTLKSLKGDFAPQGVSSVWRHFCWDHLGGGEAAGIWWLLEGVCTHPIVCRTCGPHNRVIMGSGAPGVAQWIEHLTAAVRATKEQPLAQDLVWLQLWHRSHLWLGVNPWPRDFQMQQVWPLKKKKGFRSQRSAVQRLRNHRRANDTHFSKPRGFLIDKMKVVGVLAHSSHGLM